MTGGLTEILHRLSACRVDFVIVGGFAAVAHGSATVTQDIDICCDFSEPNLKKLYKAVQDLHPIHRLSPHKPPLQITPAFCKGLKNLYLDTDMGVLDCLSSIRGLGHYENVKKHSVVIKGMEDLKFRVLSLDSLIRAKKAMDRPKDAETVIQLQAIQDRRKEEGGT